MKSWKERLKIIWSSSCGVRIRLVLFFALIFVTICSFFSVTIFRTSIIEAISNTCLLGWLKGVRNWAADWYQTMIVAELVKRIGLISVLITWTYSHLSDRKLGVSNHELLAELSPFYHEQVFTYAVSIVVCFWSSSLNQRELSFLSLLLIAIGMISHWKILFSLVLNKAKGVELAIDYYECQLEQIKQEDERIEKETGRDEEKDELTTNKVVAIATQMVNEASIDNLQNKRFSDIIAKYFVWLADPKTEGLDVERKIRTLASLWDRIVPQEYSDAWLPAFSSLSCSIDRSVDGDEPVNVEIFTIIYAAFFCSLWMKKFSMVRTAENSIVMNVQNKLREDVVLLEETRRIHNGSGQPLLIAYGYSLLIPFLEGGNFYSDLLLSVKGKIIDRENHLQEEGCKFVYYKMLNLLYDQQEVELYFEMANHILLSLKAQKDPQEGKAEKDEDQGAAV